MASANDTQTFEILSFNPFNFNQTLLDTLSGPVNSLLSFFLFFLNGPHKYMLFSS